MLSTAINQAGSNVLFVGPPAPPRGPTPRREKQPARWALAGATAVLLTISTLLGLLVLYLLKSAAGIDLFPGFSLGIWGWF